MKNRSGVTEIRYKSRNNSGKTIRTKDKVLKINGKEYGFLTTYIANCAQLYAFLKDGFLVRIGGKLRRVRYYSYKLFDYRGHICLSEPYIINWDILGILLAPKQAMSNFMGTHLSLAYASRDALAYTTQRFFLASGFVEK